MASPSIDQANRQPVKMVSLDEFKRSFQSNDYFSPMKPKSTDLFGQAKLNLMKDMQKQQRQNES